MSPSSNLPSCLGGVSPFFEPLKVCLDDDSSFDEDDMFDDEDFFIEDYELGLVMDIDPQNKAEPDFSSIPCSLPQVKATTITENENQLRHKLDSTILDSLQSSFDQHGATNSSLDGISNSSSLTSPFYFSTGNLTSVSNDSSVDTKNSKPKSKRRVSLHNDVAVLPIPQRDEYSDRVKERLWSSASELYLNATRNSIEFAAEGFNWRNATEDENMIVCNLSGELIHPIHLHNFVRQHTNKNGGSTLPNQVPLDARS